jgi:regulator of protease activity HflC (stomatin/prohibitin superfamily)
MRAIMPFVMVPQREVVIIERFGRFTRQVHPGLSFKIPFFENVAYSHSLKE